MEDFYVSSSSYEYNQETSRLLYLTYLIYGTFHSQVSNMMLRIEYTVPVHISALLFR
jgi:hypothetical protein